LSPTRFSLRQVPVPLSATDVAEAPPPVATFRLADFRPVEVGMNATLAEQLPPTGTWAGQSLVCENWPPLGPPMLIELMGSTTVPVLLITTVWAALVALRATSPNVRAVGETE
jgi:hypothetical protein